MWRDGILTTKSQHRSAYFKCVSRFGEEVPDGLDYISSSGAQAFNDLCEVAELLGDAREGMGWAEHQQSRLRESKRYLKSE